MQVKTAAILVALVLAIASSAAQEKQGEVRQLAPGQTVEREIAGGETRSYRVTLLQGQFLRAVVNSHDIDVVATFYGPDGQKLLTVDLLKYPGPEPVSFEAEKAGEYRLEIRADAAPVVHGRYELASEVKPQALETDRQRLTAERLLIEANDLEHEGSKESLQKSIDKRSEALVLWRKLGDRYWEAYSLHYSGRASSTLNKNQEALAFYGQALSIRKAIGDRVGEAATLNNSGGIYERLGQKEKALDHYNQAVAISRAIGDPIGEARTLGNLGNLFDGLGKKQKALEFYNQALQLTRAVGDKSGETNTLNNLGIVYSDLGEKQKALEFFNQALPLERAVGDKSREAATLINLGAVYSDLGEKQKALEFYNQALPLKRAVGDKSGEANTLNHLGTV
jgi:tetratricopeptide (TPR) repeat protein